MLEVSRDDLSLPESESQLAELAGVSSVDDQTPTSLFSLPSVAPATDGPARARRRRRWKTGLPPRAAMLSTFSFVLMVAGVGAYIADVPGMIAKSGGTAAVPMHALAFLDESAKSAALQVAGETGASTTVGAPLATASGDATQSALATSLGLANSSNPLSGVSSLVTSSNVAGFGDSAFSSSADNVNASNSSAAPGVADSFVKAVEQAKKNESSTSGNSTESGKADNKKSDSDKSSADSGSSSDAKSDSSSSDKSNGSSNSNGSDDSGNSNGSGKSDSSTGSNDSSGSGNSGNSGGSADSTPSTSDDAQGAQKAADLYSDLNTCVELMNRIIKNFNNDAMNGSMQVRQEHAADCETLNDLTLQGFLSARDSYYSSTVWNNNKEAIMSSFMKLNEYLTIYEDAWARNLAFDNPSDNYDYWFAPIKEDLDSSGNSIKAAEFKAAYSSISL